MVKMSSKAFKEEGSNMLVVFKKFVIGVMATLGCMVALAGTASADGISSVPQPYLGFVSAFVYLFFVNFPINTIIYLLLLAGLLTFRKNCKMLFSNSTPLFVCASLVVSVFVTICGAFIDIGIVMHIISGRLPSILLLFALFLVFLSFLATCMFVQRLDIMESIFMGLCMGIPNAIFWLLQMRVPFRVISVSELEAMYICFLIMLISFTCWYAWKHKQLREEEVPWYALVSKARTLGVGIASFLIIIILMILFLW